MLFNSFTYMLVFLPLVVIAYWQARDHFGRNAAQAVLLASSAVFYAFSRPDHLLILAGSIVFNWAAGQVIASSEGRRRKIYLWLGLTGDIGLLCLFKYVNFFLRNIAYFTGPHFSLPDWEFPLGISFFTLIQVMYLVDCYEGLVPANGIFNQATFASFFPYVTSGPLVRAKSMIRQFERSETDSEDRFAKIARGLYLFTLGLSKKVLFADTFARIADAGFAGNGGMSTLEAWVFSLAYTMQIYFDFSGYSDMAIGSALMLGIEIPINFNAPYKSKSIIEFWQRWHISLSNFITTYLYTPILRKFKRATPSTAAVATLVAMGIAGLWHGPAWTFVCFGLMHGIALVANQFWKKSKRKMPNWLGWLLTFSFVNVAFIVFRSPSIAFAAHMCASLVPHGAIMGTALLSTVDTYTSLAVIGFLAAFFGRDSNQMAREFKLAYTSAFATAAMTICCWLIMNSTVAKRFVYFAF